MNTPFFYGLILALGNIVLTLVFFFLGYQTDRMLQGRWIVTLLPLVVAIVVMWLGIKATREEAKDGALSYGKGVGAGMLIILYSSLIGAIYTFIHFTFFNPSFADYAVDLARQQWIARGMSDSQMEVAEKFTRFIYKPAVLAVAGVIVSALIGLVISLILSAFLKRKSAPAIAPESPPVVSS
ncbi:MAG TPA: DUF4199 domain-containing protein [Opitutaceae bacterium]|nr:DUF4199 domain-containing protein [Opitutaceae bacterium]